MQVLFSLGEGKMLYVGSNPLGGSGGYALPGKV